MKDYHINIFYSDGVAQSMAFENQPVSMERLKALRRIPKAKGQ